MYSPKNGRYPRIEPAETEFIMKQTPNIIYILADDMGYGDFGIFGDGSSRTPSLDRLVSEGCALSHCYAASPVCAPARAALPTGRYPHRPYAPCAQTIQPGR